MISIVQISKSYHYSISANEKLSINVSNFFSQEIFLTKGSSKSTVAVDSIKAHVEVCMGEMFTSKPTSFAIYKALEELLMPVAKRILRSNKRVEVLLAIEDSRLYAALRQALIKNKGVSDDVAANRIHEICSVLNYKTEGEKEISEAEDTEILFLAVEGMVIKALAAIDIVIIDLNKDINTPVRESFEQVLDYSYKKTDISKLHVGATTIDDVIKKAKFLNNEGQAEKMNQLQKDVVSGAYIEMLNNFDRLCKGDLHDTDVDLKPKDLSAIVFTAPNIQ